MPANDEASGHQDNLVSAAHAAASWARARRATWTSLPPASTVAPPVAPGGDFVFDLEPIPAPSTPPVFETAPAGAPLTPAIVPSGVRPATSLPLPSLNGQPAATAPSRLPAIGAAMLPWAGRAAIAAALIAAVVVGGRYAWNALPTLSKPTETVASKPAASKPGGGKAAAPGAGTKGTGSLRVTSNPAGARVLVDGKARGVTPLSLADLGVGRHEIALQGDAGTVNRTVTIAANTTATVDEDIFAGFVTVYAPFDVTITEKGRVLTADDRHQVMLPAGGHDLRLTNRALGFDAIRHVDVTPGDTTNLQLTPEPSTLTVTATDAAEVWLDGTRLGDTPLNGAPVQVGVHEIIVKRASGGQRLFNVTIGSKPFTLNVDFP